MKIRTSKIPQRREDPAWLKNQGLITITSVEDQIKVRGLAKSNSFLFSVASGSFLGQIQNSRYGISERKGD